MQQVGSDPTLAGIKRQARPADFDVTGYNRPRFMAIRIGTQFGSYEIIDLLGKGGHG
jgi:hypothetical protein